MRLFDERSGELRNLEVRPRMGVYVCGITPYDAAHLGHAFTYVHFDVLVRYLRHLGAEVTHVQNVTDVDDDMLRVAKERGVDYLELAAREVASFERAMETIGVASPTHAPRATQYVAEMIEEVEILVEAGHGYERNGTVFFRVASDPGYGRLSGLTREQMLPLAAERGGHPEDPDKDDPLDFVLWQRSAPGEPWWESPWSRGRPGWHIECSTMSRRLLGKPLDVHGGGSDLIYPHHESELAQAEGAPGGKPFVLHWMHTGTVHMAGDKMSKSIGNLAFVHELLERHSPSALRSFLLRRHYRKDWEFREEDLELEGLGGTSLDVGDGRASFDPAADREAFYRALDTDLDTPEAMRILDHTASSSDPAAKELLEDGKEILGLVDL
jgi:L-cysteine:1D-myo-inositol 2-amino-2-deoxy-alpha-D-glucopyranoside ligase